MALLYEIAHYYLNSLECSCRKAGILKIMILKDEHSPGISSALYVPRRMTSLNNAKTAAGLMASKTISRDKRTGYGRCRYYRENVDQINADLEVFSVGLALANQSSSIRIDIQIQTNIDSCDIIKLSVNIFVYIPIHPTEKSNTAAPGKWSVTDNKMKYFNEI